MYRRVELINKYDYPGMDPDESPYLKLGILGGGHEDISDAWIDELHGSRCAIPGNSRLYFTEEGWRKVGRKVVAACQRVGQEYRVIAVKENAVDVVFRDPYEIAAQPIRKWRKAGARRGKYLP